MNYFHSINTLRLFAAIGVICIHSFAGFTTPYNDIISGISRFAVPTFFMITGFFLYDSTCYLSMDHFKKQSMNFLRLFIKYTTIYFVLSLLLNISSLPSYLSFLFSFEHIFEFLVLNQSHINESLWYLSASLYAIILFYILIKIKSKRFFLFIAIVLLLAHLLLGTYSIYIVGFQLPYIFTRNFLFTALPFLLIGYLLHYHLDTIRRKITPAISILLVVISTLGLGLEISLSSYFSPYINKELYFFTIPFCLFLFIFALTRQNTKETRLSRYGKKYAFYIYILHPWLLVIIRTFLSNYVGIYTPFLTILVTFGICLLLSMIVDKIKETTHKRKYSY